MPIGEATAMSQDEIANARDDIISNPTKYRLIRTVPTTDELFAWEIEDPKYVIRIPADLPRSRALNNMTSSMTQEPSWSKYTVSLDSVFNTKESDQDVEYSYSIYNVIVQSCVSFTSESILLDIELKKHRLTISMGQAIASEGGFVPCPSSIWKAASDTNVDIPPVLEEQYLGYYMAFYGSIYPPFSPIYLNLLYLISPNGHLVIYAAQKKRDSSTGGKSVRTRHLPLHQEVILDFDAQDPIWLDPHFPILYRMRKQHGLELLMLTKKEDEKEVWDMVSVGFYEFFPRFHVGHTSLLIPTLQEIYSKRTFVTQQALGTHMFHIDLHPYLTELISGPGPWKGAAPSISKWEKTRAANAYAYESTVKTEIVALWTRPWARNSFIWIRPGIPFPFFSTMERNLWAVLWNMTMVSSSAVEWKDVFRSEPISINGDLPDITKVQSIRDAFGIHQGGYSANLLHASHLARHIQILSKNEAAEKNFYVETPFAGLDEEELAEAAKEGIEDLGPKELKKDIRSEHKKIWIKHLATMFSILGIDAYLVIAALK